jgi:hypothetical protein
MIEQCRVVLEVADGSDSIRGVFERLREVVEHAATGGRPVIDGAPIRIQDRSDITFPAWLSPAAVTNSEFLETWLRFAPAEAASWAPTIVLTAPGETGKYPGNGTGVAEYVLQLRVGTSPEDLVVFSSAPLDSQAHHEYAVALMAVLGQVPPAP